MIDPAACRTMTDVRAGVDAVDRDLARLIGVRFAFMDAAARIKPDRDAVRDEGRKAQVIANIAVAAAANCWAPDLAKTLWDQLVEASIAHELARFDTLNPSDAG